MRTIVSACFTNSCPPASASRLRTNPNQIWRPGCGPFVRLGHLHCVERTAAPHFKPLREVVHAPGTPGRACKQCMMHTCSTTGSAPDAPSAAHAQTPPPCMQAETGLIGLKSHVVEPQSFQVRQSAESHSCKHPRQLGHTEARGEQPPHHHQAPREQAQTPHPYKRSDNKAEGPETVDTAGYKTCTLVGCRCRHGRRLCRHLTAPCRRRRRRRRCWTPRLAASAPHPLH